MNDAERAKELRAEYERGWNAAMDKASNWVQWIARANAQRTRRAIAEILRTLPLQRFKNDDTPRS